MDLVSCDVLVMGSGAGGLAAAITAAHAGLKVIVAEKAPLIGGTTARSGGYLWAPLSGPTRRAGIEDSAENVRRYMMAEIGNHYEADRVDAFLAACTEAVAFFEDHTALQFDPAPQLPDYHAETPGGLDGGRPIVARPCDGRILGSEIRRLRPPLREITVAGMMIGSSKDLPHFLNATRSVRSAVHVAGVMARYGLDLARHGRSMRLTNGNALAARLLRSALDAGVDIWTEAPVSGLLHDDKGRVTGATVEREGAPVTVRASAGVVLAAGGFPQDMARRARMFPHAGDGSQHWSPAPEANTGDGIALGLAAGGQVPEDLPNAAAWVPVSLVPRPDGSRHPFPHFVDRGKPGMIAVTRNGRRFVNEGKSYHDFCEAMQAACRDLPAVEAWLICDHPTFRRYGLGFAKPAPLPYSHLIRAGYVLRGATLADLGRQAEIDPGALEATVARVNADASAGEDTEFGRGSTAYSRYLGDPAAPSPYFGAVKVAPFYAVRLVIGDLGTFAGLKTDGRARVLGTGGVPVPGLFAAGNDAHSIMGGNYLGGGITLGPAVVFGYIAGRELAAIRAP
ncbi:MAG: FAD-dependent oxidoreductase [Pararhodobacter sp.]|nr:FAD-dependent oxidoreductase [Pararhodobacter sp.]